MGAKTGGRTLLALHALLAAYSLGGVCSKLAAGYDFMSPGFVLCYGAMVAVLGVYALGWQQVIKRMPLTSAYANKAVTVVWGIVWGAVLFNERVSALKLLGAAVVLVGVVLFSLADGERREGTEAASEDGEGV